MQCLKNLESYIVKDKKLTVCEKIFPNIWISELTSEVSCLNSNCYIRSRTTTSLTDSFPSPFISDRSRFGHYLSWMFAYSTHLQRDGIALQSAYTTDCYDDDVKSDLTIFKPRLVPFFFSFDCYLS